MLETLAFLRISRNLIRNLRARAARRNFAEICGPRRDLRPCLSSYHHSTSPTRPLHSQATRHCPRSLNTNIPSLSHHVSTIPSPLPALSPPFVRCTSASAPPGYQNFAKICGFGPSEEYRNFGEICGSGSKCVDRNLRWKKTKS